MFLTNKKRGDLWRALICPFSVYVLVDNRVVRVVVVCLILLRRMSGFVVGARSLFRFVFFGPCQLLASATSIFLPASFSFEIAIAMRLLAKS